jgi:general secretion pathway protein D
MKLQKTIILFATLIIAGQAQAGATGNTQPVQMGVVEARTQSTAVSTQDNTTKITEVEFTGSQISDVVRTLSELSKQNIIATPEAANRSVTIHLKNVSILDAVKSISRISDLWYRYDEDTDTYRLMTREQYSKDLIVRESENIEIFRLLNANVLIIAQAIEDLFGQRVILSYGLPPASNSFGNNNTTGSGIGGVSSGRSIRGGGVRGNNRSVRNSSRGNRFGSSRGGISGRFGQGNLAQSGAQLDSDELTVDQVEQLAQAIEQSGQRNVSQEALQQATIQSQPIYVTVNNEHNMLIVRSDDKSVLAGIEQLIDKMDIPVPQVMLEMRILSVLLGEDFDSIFNFEIRESLPGGNDADTPLRLGNNALLNSGTFVYQFLNDRLRMNLQFLEENNRVRVLSNPMVVASNHRQAELFVGEETLLTEGFDFFPAIVDNGVVVQPAYVQAIVTREDIGITLRITPRINGDDTVELFIEQENSTVNPGGGVIPVTDGEGTVQNLPVDTVDTARLTGTVMARDGLTVAVGGLIRTSTNKNERKVPILSEIPIIGRVFRSTREREEETETVLLITPRLMNTPEDSEQLRQSDNRFYRDYNQHQPPMQDFENKFIDIEKAAEESEFIPTAEQADAFKAMTNYAAQMSRTPDVQRPDSEIYQSVRVIPIAAGMFSEPAIKTVPQESWQKGSLYVTAVSLFNRSDKVIQLSKGMLRGDWLSVAMEAGQLAPTGTDDASTMLYLVSDQPFDDVITALSSPR